MIYADFESILKPIDKVINATTYYQQHHLCSTAALLVSTIPEIYNTFAIFTGRNALSEFLNKLIHWETECIEHLKRNAPMNKLNKQQQNDYDNAKQCYLCRRDFQGPEDPKGGKVPDHDHITGHFLGAAHNVCNLNRPVKYQIPVFFNNFRGYDSHLIVHEFPRHKDREIKVIGQNMEKYLQVQWGKHIVFRDSIHFLTSSLDQLVKSPAKSGHDKFHHLEQVVPLRYPNTNVDLLKQKGILCYDYIDSFERLTEKALPARELFTSRLSGAECSQVDYEHAKQVWRVFQCQTLEEYMELYLLCDVCLLADVFEQFRKTSLEEYQLDPAYFVSAPQLAWSALLKYINRPIYLISDPEMYRMIQPSIREGICHSSVRYARANNKLMG